MLELLVASNSIFDETASRHYARPSLLHRFPTRANKPPTIDCTAGNCPFVLQQYSHNGMHAVRGCCADIGACAGQNAGTCTATHPVR